MNKSLYRAAKPIFDAACDLPPDQRSAQLDRACGGNDALRRFVEELLATHDADTRAGSPTLDRAIERSLIFAEEPGAVIERFELKERIGEGGFGTVWSAEQLLPVQRPVALKVLKAGMDTEKVVARFEAERQALALMDHPHIAQVYDGGATPSGRPYFAMELVNGVPVTEYCHQRDLPLRRRLELFINICGAIQHAHQKGIIHRDVKPSNVLVTEHEGAPYPKVIDFGIAKAIAREGDTDAQLTEQHQVIGTPEYMAPEQLDGGVAGIDTRADVYALGVLLYELLTGSRPFESVDKGRGFSALLDAIRHQEPQKPSTRVATRRDEATKAKTKMTTVTGPRMHVALRGDLDWIVLRALRKERDQRYESAGSLAADIARHLRNEPVLAGPPSRIYKLRKFVVRNRGTVLASALVLLSMVFGLVGTGVALNWALSEQARALERFELAMNAVDDYHTGVAKDAVLKRPELLSLRTRLLQAPREFYMQLEQSLSKESSNESRTALARALEGLGTLAIEVGELDDASATLRRAVDLHEQLAANGSARGESRFRRGRLFAYLGALHLRQGDLDKAIGAFDEAVEILTRLQAQTQPNPQLWRQLADVYMEYGHALSRRGDSDAGVARWREALALHERIRASGAEQPGLEAQTADALLSMGKLAFEAEDYDQSASHLVDGMNALVEARAQEPDSVQLLAKVAACATELGRAREYQGKDREALAAYQQSVDVGKQLHDKYPAAAEHRYALGNANSRIAGMHVKLRNHRAAERHYRRAFDLLEGASSLGDRIELATALMKAASADLERREYAQARPRLERAAEMFDALVEESGELMVLELASTCYSNLAGPTRRGGDLDEAKDLYERAITLRKRCITQRPADPLQQLNLCSSLLSLARLHFEQQRFDPAIDCYTQSIEASEAIAPTYAGQGDARYDQMHRAGYWGRANAYQRAKRYADAAADWLRAGQADTTSKMKSSFLVQMLADLDRGGVLTDIEATVADAVENMGATAEQVEKASKGFLAETDNEVYRQLGAALAARAKKLAEGDGR